MYGVADKLVYALILCGRDGNNGDTQKVFHLVYADRAAVTSDLVHHVESQNNGNIQLHELEGEIKASFDTVCIGNIDDSGRSFV